MYPSIKRCCLLLCILSLFAIDPGCSDESECPVCPSGETETVTVDHDSDTHFAELVSGDYEFGSNHGPLVTFVAYSYVEGDTSLMCYVSMNAVEHPGGSNITVARISAVECAYTASQGWKIVDTSAKPCTVQYHTHAHGWHTLSCDSWTIHYVGDTYQDDICPPPPYPNENCTRFYFNFSSEVTIQKL
jgi:hypothetical protein